MSEAKTLTTLFPVSYELPLAGRLVRVGRLKLRQKAELQAWLDGLPEPNERVKSALAELGRTGWPLRVSGDLSIFAAIEFSARQKFLSVALAPFNPGLSADELKTLIDESDDEAEFIAILRAAFGRDPHAADEDEPPKAEGDDPAKS
jgi:hypothetical protein